MRNAYATIGHVQTIFLSCRLSAHMSVRNWTAASTLSADRRSQPLSVNRWGYACQHMIGCIANPNDWIFRLSATVGKVVTRSTVITRAKRLIVGHEKSFSHALNDGRL